MNVVKMVISSCFAKNRFKKDRFHKENVVLNAKFL
jgi:hypothetical protein